MELSSVKLLFGREKPVHAALGRDKIPGNAQTSAGGGGGGDGANVFWLLSECLAYYLPAHICHAFILATTVMFVWSKASAFISKQQVPLPRISFSKLFQEVASALIFEISELFAFAVIHGDASGRDLTKFLMVVAGLWFLSVASSWPDFFTLFYHVLHVFRQITRALISSPGFNEIMNDFCDFLLGLATSSSMRTLQPAMFIPGIRSLILIAMKKQGKKLLVYLLAGSGENYNNAKAFVDQYVTDRV